MRERKDYHSENCKDEKCAGCKLPHMTTPKSTVEKKCCERCSGRVEDENAFSRNYGCQNDDCSCHQPKSPLPVDDWEEEFDSLFGPDLFDPKEQEKASAAFVDLHAPTKNFIRTLLTTQSTTLKEELIKEIEDYFKGLIHVPFPQKTKENLISLIKNHE